MSELKIYHNPKCSKSREALNFLIEKGLSFEIIEYLKTPLKESEVVQLIKQLPTAAGDLVRTKEVGFQEDPFDLNSIAEVSKHLALKPHLMERPVVVYKDQAVIGRPLEAIARMLKDLKHE